MDIIEKMSIIRPHANEGKNQIVNYVFANDDHNTVRLSDVATVHNTDVSALDMSQPVDWVNYRAALTNGQQDVSQSLDVEIPHRFRMLDPQASEGVNRTVRYVMKNKDVSDAINQTSGP